MKNFKTFIFYGVVFHRGRKSKREFSKTLDLGIFSSMDKAKKKIELSRSLSGFSNYPKENFIVFRYIVKCPENIKKQDVKKLYWLYFEADYDDFYQCDDFGYYYLKTLAEKDKRWLQKHNRVGKHYPNDFHIIRVKVDLMTDWSEGFIEYD